MRARKKRLKMAKSNSKRVAISGGKNCPKCHRPMQRFEHPSTFKPKRGQPYFFVFWDVCRTCRHIQHYEEAKTFIGPATNELNRMDLEFSAIVGGRR